MVIAQNQITESVHSLMVMHPWLFVGWMTVVGSAIGSFLNVVIYRLPVGLNIAYPASRCPKCEKPIQGIDNIPILSWMFLGGKCRNCKLPISVRYPMIEAIVGLAFCLLAIACVNIDVTTSLVWQLQLQLLFHAAMFCCLLAIAMIRFDQHPQPSSLLIFTLLISVGGIWLAPNRISMWAHYLYVSDSNFINSMIAVVAGFVKGGLLGWLLPANTIQSRIRRAGVWGIIGSYLSWPTTVLVGAIVSVVTFARSERILRQHLIIVPMIALASAVVAIQDQPDPWHVTSSSIRVPLLSLAVLTIAIASLANRFERPMNN